MKFALLIFCFWTLGQCSENWVPLPPIPSRRRSEYFLLQNDGGYKYGLDTGTGIFAKQSATAENEVKGHYGHQAGGKVIDVKYTAGAEGFRLENPESYGGLVSHAKSYSPVLPINRSSVQNPDGSYSFSYESGESTRSESRDRNGQVEGQYSYNDDSGYHDLSYKAGPGTGFVPTGGNLATPNGDSVSSEPYLPPKGEIISVTTGSDLSNPDGSYSFAYSTSDSARSESGDSSGHVQGKYSYKNEAGNHDLSYISGPETGFVATGGSLSVPNGLKVKDLDGGRSVSEGTSRAYLPPSDEESSSTGSSSSNPDGSYNFAYATKDSARSESSDSSGHVKGQYSYRNEAGNHDLSYIAGPETGFVPTGGNLASPNGLKENNLDNENGLLTSTSRVYLFPTAEVTATTGSSSSKSDGSYSFGYSTGDSTRSESGDANGNVQGQYSYTNEAGHNDLSYIAGSETGFVATGGSLSVPNGLKVKDLGSGSSANEGTSLTPSGEESSSTDSSSSNPDGSYNFAYATKDSSRSESSDSSGHVQGQYSYRNEAGNHDLSYIAGPETGFVPTGGSLAIPNGLRGKDLVSVYGVPETFSAPTLRAYLPPSGEKSSSIGSSSLNPDGSYSFAYSTSDSARSESGDSSGHVQGKYSYKNEAGNHDLSYISGPETGFVATGGSLSIPNGLRGKELKNFNSFNDIKQTPVSGPRKIYQSFGEVKTLNVLPVPGNYKSGYILY